MATTKTEANVDNAELTALRDRVAELESKLAAPEPAALEHKPGLSAHRVEAMLEAQEWRAFCVRDDQGRIRHGELVKPGDYTPQADGLFPPDTPGVWTVSLPSVPVLKLPGTFGDRRGVERRYEDLMNVNSVARHEVAFVADFTPEGGAAA